jgi:hypothetical protein
MNQDYINLFADAQHRSTQMHQSVYENSFSITSGIPVDHEQIRKAVADDIADGVVSNTWALAGRCFLAVRELSYILFNLKIPHALTVGNVDLDGTPYFTTTLSSLAAEFAEGYIPGKPANAHSWITLPDGSTLDATLAASIANREGQTVAPSFYDAILVATHPLSMKLRYRPMLTGFHYHFGVVSHPFLDRHYKTYVAWLRDYHKVTGFSWWHANNENFPY